MNRIIAIFSVVALATVTAFAQQPPRKASPPPPPLQVYGQYSLIQAALAGDALTGVATAAVTIIKLVRSDAKLPAGIADAAKVSIAADLNAARVAFKELSDALVAHRQTDGTVTERFYVIHCSMAFDNQGASWLQATKTASNPYFGASMLRCGSLQK
jgi:Cu(I)/Ag(I) efflux system membrane fusion protein